MEKTAYYLYEVYIYMYTTCLHVLRSFLCHDKASVFTVCFRCVVEIRGHTVKDLASTGVHEELKMFCSWKQVRTGEVTVFGKVSEKQGN